MRKTIITLLLAIGLAPVAVQAAAPADTARVCAKCAAAKANDKACAKCAAKANGKACAKCAAKANGKACAKCAAVKANGNAEAVRAVHDFLKACPYFAVATVDGNRPQVRPFSAIDLHAGVLYIMSGRSKAVARQVTVNPAVCITAVREGKNWIRIDARLVDEPCREAKQSMLDANPDLKGMCSVDDPNMVLWRLADVTATIHAGGKTQVYRF